MIDGVLHRLRWRVVSKGRVVPEVIVGRHYAATRIEPPPTLSAGDRFLARPDGTYIVERRRWWPSRS